MKKAKRGMDPPWPKPGHNGFHPATNHPAKLTSKRKAPGGQPRGK